MLQLERLEDRLAPAVHDITTPGTFATIQAAVDAANPGDTLLADPGTYNEHVTVNKALIILGAQHGVDAQDGRPGAMESIVDGGGFVPFFVTASNVTIDGFTIQGATNNNNAFPNLFGVELNQGTSGSQILNDIIQNNDVGIALANNSATTPAIIQHNLIQNNNQPGSGSGDGIYSDQFVAGGTLSDVLIDSNTFIGNSDAGLDFSSTDATKPATNITISNNVFDANARGMLAFSLTNSSITSNTFENSTSSATADIRLFEGVNGLTISGNLLENGAGRAVRVNNEGSFPSLPNATNVTLSENSISGYTGPTDTVNVDPAGYSGTLNASGNWWGTAIGANPSDPIAPTAIEAIVSGPVHIGSFLDSGANAATGPGFTPKAATEMWVPVTGATSGLTRVSGVIQDGINTAVSGMTVRVAADTYAENDTVNKSLTLLGANAGINPNTGPRGAETVWTTAVNDPTNNAIPVVHVVSNQVTLDGFTLDGINPGLGSSIQSSTGVLFDLVSHVTYQNNIAQNFLHFGISGVGDNGSNTTASGDDLVQNSLFKNMPGETGVGYGEGVDAANNFYVSVQNNVFQAVRRGMQFGNFYRPDPGAPAVISGNQIDAGQIGIWMNLFYQSADGITIQNNTITSTFVSSVISSPTPDANRAGIFFASLTFDGVGNTVGDFTVSNNNISGMYDQGILFWNNSKSVTVSGGTIDGSAFLNRQAGVRYEDQNPYYGDTGPVGSGGVLNLSGVTIQNAQTGIQVAATLPPGNNILLPITVTGGTSISGGTTGILVSGAHAILSFSGSNPASLSSLTGNYITLASGAEFGNTVDATGVSFDGLTGATATLAQNFAIEDKIFHAVDDGTLGFIRVKAANVFVTPNSGSIQRGVNAAASGDTVNVAAGTFAENVTISKALTLDGAQAGQNANTRFAAFTTGVNGPKADPTVETVLTAPVVNPTGGNPNANDLIRVVANNITIDGLVIDGNNPALGASPVQVGTINIDARRGIQNSDANNNFFDISNLVVRNNIIQNVAQRGVELSNNSSVSTGNLITGNVVRSFGSDPVNGGLGIILFTNAYADVTNNTIVDTVGAGLATGLQLQNFYLTGSMTWSGNNITVGQDDIGIIANLFYAPAGVLNIQNNTVNAAAGVTATSDLTWGIYVLSVQVGSTVNVSSDTVGSAGGQFARGINLWNLPTTSTVTVSGGSVARSDIGIDLDSVDPYFGAGAATTADISNVTITGGTIGVRVAASTVNQFFPPPTSVDPTASVTANLTGVTINGATTGVLVQGFSGSISAAATLFHETITGATTGVQVNGNGNLGIAGGTSVSGGSTGLLLSGPNTSVTGNTLNDTSFTGQTGQYIQLTGGALFGQTIDATGVSFDGLTGATATLAQNFAIEDKIFHATDDGTLGFIRVKAANVFVTPNSGSIQRGVNAAASGDTVHVQAGTYNELVQVTKTLTLDGAQAGVDAQNGRPGAMESIVSNSTGDFQIEADNVTIDGFTLTGVTSDPNVNPASLGAAIWTNPGFSGTHGGHVIQNNIIQGNIAGIELDNDGTFQTTVQHNLIQNNNQLGAGAGTGIEVDFGLTNALITNNTISTNQNAGVLLAAAGSAGVTISQNLMSGNANAVALLNAGSVASPIVIDHNTITASTASQIVIGGGDNGVQVTHNIISNGLTQGVVIADPFSVGPNANVTVNNNSIQGNATAGFEEDTGGYTPKASGALDATNNFWGSTTGPTTPNNPGGTGDAIIDQDGVVNFSPYLTDGTNTASGRGFDPVAGATIGITVDGTSGADTLIVTATSANGGSYSLNGGPAVPFSNVTRFTFAGMGGNDSVTVNNPAGGLFAPADGFFYYDNGGASLEIVGGTETTATYNFLPDTAAGHDGTIDLVNGAITAHYAYSGLSPLSNSGTVSDVIFNLPSDGQDNKAILEAASAGMDDIRSQNGTFETAQFSNPTASLMVNDSNDGETVTVSTLDSGFAAPITLNGGTGNDTFNVTPSANFSVTANGDAPTTAPGDALNVDVTGTTDPTLTSSGGVSQSGMYTFGNRQPVNFTSIESLSPTTADLAITKTDTPDPVLAGNNITYSITVTNSGPLASVNVQLTDATPTNTTFVSLAVPAGWTAGAGNPAPGGTGQVTATDPNLAPGTTSIFTLVVHASPSTPNNTVISNTATVFSSTTQDSNSLNNQANATTTVNTAADLAVTKTSSAGAGTVTAGSQLTYTVALTNNGPSDSQGVVLTDTLSANETFQSSSDSGAGTFTPATIGNTTTFTATAPFGPGSVHTFLIIAQVNSNTANGDTASNTASAASTGPNATPDPNTGNDSAMVSNVVVTSADVQLTKTGPAAVTAGQNITYTVTYSNAGPSDAPNAVLTDSTPAGTTFVSFTPPAGWTTTNLPAPGGTGLVRATDPDVVAGAGPQVFTLIVATDPNANAPSTVTNTASGLSGAADPNTNNNDSTATTAVGTAADIAVTKTSSAGAGTVNAGDLVTYTISLTNIGPNPSQGVVLTDTLSANETFQSSSDSGSGTFTPSTVGNTTTFTATGPFASGAAHTFTVIARVNSNTSAGDTASDTASVASTGPSATPDPNTGNNSATVSNTVLTQADLVTTKIESPDPVIAGQNLTYTISVSNSGPSDAQNVTLTDNFPPGLSFQSANASQGSGVLTGSQLNFNFGTIASGATATLTITFGVSANTPNGTVLTNQATAVSNTADPNTNNNTGTSMTTVTNQADLSVTKTTAQTPIPGTDITYTIALSNAGPNTAQNVSLTDMVPANTTFVSFTSDPAFTRTDTTPAGGTGTITATDSAFASGAGATFTLVVHIDPGTPGGVTITNMATAAMNSTIVVDPNTGNNTGTATTTTTAPVADVAITKVGPATVTAGTDITYTITVTNNGPSDALGVQTTDSPPANTTLVSFVQDSGPPDGGTLPAGATQTFTLILHLNADQPNGTTITNIADTSSVGGTPDPNTANNESKANSTVAATADLAITKTGPSTALAGTQVTYTLSLTNPGPSDAQGVSVTDTLPVGETFVSASEGMGAGTSYSDTIGTFAAGATRTVTIVAMVASSVANNTTLTDTANATSATTDNNPANNTATFNTLVGTQADIATIKTDTPDPVIAGQTITYTLSVTNTGPSDAQNVNVTDAIPPNTAFATFISISQGTASEGGGGPVLVNFGPIPAGGSANLVFAVAVNSSAPNGSTILNTATAVSSTADNNVANNTATTTTTVNTQADLLVSKSGPATVTAGADVTYTITLTNNGPSDAQGVSLTDAVPAGTTFVSATPVSGQNPDGFSYSQAGGTVTGTPTGGTVASGNNDEFTLVVHALASDADGSTITNTATVTSTTADDDDTVSDETATVSGTVATSADVALTKTGPATAVAGTQVTYTLSVTNNGPSDAQTVMISDTLPAGETFVSASTGTGSGTSYSSGDLGTLAAGGSETVTLVAMISSSQTAGTLTDSAFVTTATTDINPANNMATFDTTVSTSADVAITKTGPATVTAGADITYTITVTNNGPSDALAVQTTDSPPANTTLVSFSQDSGPPDGGTLPAGATQTFILVLNLNSNAANGSSLTNTADTGSTGGTPDANTANNESKVTSTVATSADLAITKTGPASATAGTPVTYTLTLTNTGPSDAQGVNVTDTLPAGITFVSSSEGTGSGGTFTDTIGTFAANATRTITVVGKVASSVANGFVATDMATVSSTTADADLTNNTATAKTTIGTESDLAITKTGPATAIAEQNFTYTLTVTNIGPSDSQGVAITDTLPTGEVFQTSTQSQGGMTVSGNVITFNLGTIAAAGTATATITLFADQDVVPDSTTLTNSATVKSTTADPVTANNTASFDTTISNQADLVITKTDSPDPVIAGNDLTYTITVSNSGPDTARSVIVTDAIPAGTTFVSATASQGSAGASGGNLTGALGSILSGATATITLVVTVNHDVPQGTTLSNTADTTMNTSFVVDPNAANNSATQPTFVDTQADLALQKTGPATVVAGTDLTYTVSITDNGPSDAQGVIMTDLVPGHTSFVSATSSQGTVNQSGGVITGDFGAISPAVPVTVTIVLHVDSGTPKGDTITNGAGVDSTTQDPNTTNNDSTATTTVDTQATLAMTVTASPSPVDEGGDLTYTVSLTNTGPSDDTNVTLTDQLPTGVVFTSATFGSISGTESGGTVTVPLGTVTAGSTVTGTIVVHTPEEQQVSANTVQATSTLSNISGTSAEVTVNDLAVNATASPLTLLAGVNLGTLTVGTFTDPAGAELTGSPYTVDVAWGDGLGDPGAITFDSTTKTFTITGQHEYAHEGFYTLTITVHHETAPDSVSTAKVSVADAPLFLTSVTPPATTTTPFAGQVARFVDYDNGGLPANFKATIDWGDGTSSDGTIAMTGVDAFNHPNFSVTASHTYASMPDLTKFKITVKDLLGGASTFKTNDSSDAVGMIVYFDESTGTFKLITYTYR